MYRTLFLSLLISAAAVAQQPAPDPLQALLAEVHQLRMDLEASTITSQRVQILLYRVQLQQASAARAATHADDVHAKLVAAQQAKAHNASDLEQAQAWLEQNRTGDPARIKSIEVQVKMSKQGLETWEKDEADWQAKDIDAQSQLRAEQSKLTELQATLDKLDQALANLTKH